MLVCYSFLFLFLATESATEGNYGYTRETIERKLFCIEHDLHTFFNRYLTYIIRVDVYVPFSQI